MERLKKILISPELTIRQTLQHMDSVGEKTLFVVNKYNKIMGSVTDGDIRRWVLRGKHLSYHITNAMNLKPMVLKEGFEAEEAKGLLTRHLIDCIPVVNALGEVVSAVWVTDFFAAKHPVIKIGDVPVFVMAGGEGSRLYPFTKVLPKPLMPVGDKPIIEIIMDKFKQYGCEKFYISINYKSSIIKAYFKDMHHSYRINYVQEKKPLGTAGSLLLAAPKIKSTVFVTNCDIVIDADYHDIVEFHKENRNVITIVSSMKHYTIPYGVCQISKSGVFSSIKEKPQYDYLVNTGMYVIDPVALKYIPSGKKYDMTELINKCISRRKKVGVYPISEKSWLDMGQWDEYKDMMKKFGVVL